MTNRSHDTFHDPIVTPDEVADLPERFFDRFVFNVHRTDATTPSVLVGLGLHPVRDTVDGFAILSTPTEQRNARFSTELSATTWETCGPFTCDVAEPNQRWQLTLGDNPTGMTFDLTWEARTPHWWGDVEVTNSSGESDVVRRTSSSPAGSTGSLTVDGETQRSSGGTASATGRAASAPWPAARGCTSGTRRSSPTAPSASCSSRGATAAGCCSRVR